PVEPLDDRPAEFPSPGRVREALLLEDTGASGEIAAEQRKKKKKQRDEKCDFGIHVSFLNQQSLLSRMGCKTCSSSNTSI
ncbi:MAG: hypothetical protein ACP5I1_21590, partial [Candidatus Hinthialibacter sp.]